MAPQFSPYLRNARISGSNINIRPGHFLFSTLTAGSYPKGISSYLRATSANDRLVVRHNQGATNKLVSITEASVATAIATGTNITSDNKMRFINTNDNLYCMNGVDAYGKLNGTTYTALNQSAVKFVGGGTKGSMTAIPQNTTVATYVITVAATGTPNTFNWTVNGAGGATGVSMATTEITLDAGMHIKFDATTGHTVGDVWTIYARMAPAFGVMFNSSVFTAGSPYAPSQVFKSAGTDVEDFNGLGTDTFTFTEKLTGLSATTQGLFYFTKNSISVTGADDITDVAGTVSYITRVMNAKEGAVNHDSIVESGIDVYFLTPNNNINKLTRGQSGAGYETMELSQRNNAGISTLMQSLDKDQSDSFGYFLPKENLIKRHLKTEGAAFNDIVVVYDTIKDVFLVDTNKYFYDATVFNSTYYACSMVEAKIFRDEFSFADENSAIPFEYRTKEFYLGDPTLKKKLWELRSQVEINELAELNQEIWLDGSLVDTKVIDKDNITEFTPGGIGTYEVGTESIGTEGPFATTIPNDIYEIDILRTKGNLNLRFKKMQIRWTNITLAGKVVLKTLVPRIEGVPPKATQLTE